MVRLFILIWIGFLSSASLYYPSGTQSKISFQIKNFGLLVEGSLSGLKGTIEFDPQHPESCQVNLSVNANSIDTGISLRNNHLKKKDYLDVNTYPEISFASEKIEKNGSEWKVTGELTIKKITKSITFPFRITPKDNGYLFAGEFNINRKDFNVGGNSFSMADELTVSFKVVAGKGK